MRQVGDLALEPQGQRYPGDPGGEASEGMTEPLDERLRDDAALDEIELTSRLMIAATSKDSPLTQAEVDEVLGISRD